MCLSVLHSPLHVCPCAESFLQLLLLNLLFHFGSPTRYLLMFDALFHGMKLKIISLIVLKSNVQMHTYVAHWLII